MNSSPRVSVCVPVYNGEAFLARTLDALLGQTFRDFELIITDNASIDCTADIANEYARRDPRIRYFRADENRGVVRNFNWCIELARGPYFHWQAADDSCEPAFLEKCVAVLDADDSVVVVFARSRIIDEQDRTIRLNDYDVEADLPRPHDRFAAFINLDHRRHCAQEVYGVIRTDALRRTGGYDKCVRTDSILLARLGLLGRFRAVDEPLFLNREHEERSVRLVPGQRAATRSRLSKWLGVGPIPPPEFWDPSVAGKINFPEWRVLLEYARSIRGAPLSAGERARCWATLARFTVGHTKKLFRDVLMGTELAILGPPPGASAPSKSFAQLPSAR